MAARTAVLVLVGGVKEPPELEVVESRRLLHGRGEFGDVDAAGAVAVRRGEDAPNLIAMPLRRLRRPGLGRQPPKGLFDDLQHGPDLGGGGAPVVHAQELRKRLPRRPQACHLGTGFLPGPGAWQRLVRLRLVRLRLVRLRLVPLRLVWLRWLRRAILHHPLLPPLRLGLAPRLLAVALLVLLLRLLGLSTA